MIKKMNFFKKLLIKYWIRIIIIIITISLLLIFAAKIYPVWETKEDQSLDEFISRLNFQIPVLLDDYDIPGINIALIKGGNLVWAKAYGYADLEKNTEMTLDTYFRVESISKSVSAWGVMKLVEQGKLDLNRPIENYIKNWEFPDSKFNHQNITASLLLSHTAGLTLGTIGPDALYNPENNLPSLQESLTEEFSLFQKANESFYYSDTGYNLLELLIEEVSGENFSEYMEKEIMLPLKMDDSSYSWSKNWSPKLARAYDIEGNPVPLYTYSMKASGNLYSTVEDIAKFLIAGMNNSFNNREVLKSKNIEKMYYPIVKDIPGYYGIVFDSYGFGHYIEWLSNGEKAVSHGGQGTGWMSHFLSLPKTGDGIILLTNSQRSWPAFAYILRDWTDWSGLSAVGMEKIIIGQKILWGITALIIFISLWQLSSVIEGMLKCRRKFTPGKEMPKFMIIFKLSAFIIIYSAVLYAINMDYQPLYSIFPIVSHWFFYSLLSLGIVFLIQVLFPNQE